MNSLLLLRVVFGVAVSGAAQAAVADKATDTTVNFLSASGAVLTTINRLDNKNQLFSGSYLAVKSVEDPSDSQYSGSDLISRTGTSPSTLTGLNQRSFAAHASQVSAQRESDAALCSAGSDNCSLFWNGPLPAIGADIEHVEFPGRSESMPSSLLLFVPGLLGFAVVARRRSGLPN